MAAADYYLCDRCECKTFYDANLHYENHNGNQNPETGHMWPEGNVGYMLVLCRDCAAKFTVRLEPKQ